MKVETRSEPVGWTVLFEQAQNWHGCPLTDEIIFTDLADAKKAAEALAHWYAGNISPVREHGSTHYRLVNPQLEWAGGELALTQDREKRVVSVVLREQSVMFDGEEYTRSSSESTLGEWEPLTHKVCVQGQYLGAQETQYLYVREEILTWAVSKPEPS